MALSIIDNADDMEDNVCMYIDVARGRLSADRWLETVRPPALVISALIGVYSSH